MQSRDGENGVGRNQRGGIGTAGRDAAFLALLVAVPMAAWVHRLGFYSDDWSLLKHLIGADDRSVFGLARAVTGPHMQMRPLHGLYFALLYRFFGTEALGYHLVNGGVLAATGVLLHLSLRELRLPRLMALAVPSIYVLLPHYSAARFWPAAFQATLSMALYALALYGELRSVRSGGARWWGWRLMIALGLIASALAYEVALPLFLLSPILAWYHAGQVYGSRRPERARAGTLAAATSIVLVPTLAFKVMTTTRLGPDDASFVRVALWLLRRSVQPDFGPTDYGLNVWRALEVHFWELGVRLPVAAWHAAGNGADGPTLLASAVVAVLVCGYLLLAARSSRATAVPDRRAAGIAIAVGLVFFGLGFAIFLTTANLQLTAAGIGNRTAIAAALGVALVFAGSSGLLSTVVSSPKRRAPAFAWLIALVCAAGALINGARAQYWAEAWDAQRRILAAIRTDLPFLPTGTRLILDGVCPYRGPAIVFESPWDLASALHILYRDPTLAADVATPRMSVEDDGLRSTLYGAEYRHPYDRLLLYDGSRRTASWIVDAAQARAYFRDRPPGHGCPPGHEGLGVGLGW